MLYLSRVNNVNVHNYIIKKKEFMLFFKQKIQRIEIDQIILIVKIAILMHMLGIRY